MRPEYSDENLAAAYQAAVAMFDQERSPGNVHVFIEAINLLYAAATWDRKTKGIPLIATKPGT